MLQKFKNMLLITNLLVGSLGVKKPSKMNFPPKKFAENRKFGENKQGMQVITTKAREHVT